MTQQIYSVEQIQELLKGISPWPWRIKAGCVAYLEGAEVSWWNETDTIFYGSEGGPCFDGTSYNPKDTEFVAAAPAIAQQLMSVMTELEALKAENELLQNQNDRLIKRLMIALI